MDAVSSPPPAAGSEAKERWAEGGAHMAAVNVSEKELEEKERRLRANIQRNYGRIRDVEKELAEMQLQLRMNVGPKRQALELLRKKIEAQTERVAKARAADAAASAAAAAAAEALAAEQRVKGQLCQELNLLVQQSARGQLEKLEQLTHRLELLNSGLTASDRGAPAEALQRATELKQNAEALRGAILATSCGGAAAEAGGGAAPAAPPLAQTAALGSEPAGPAPRQAQQQPKSGRSAEAEEAAARHVQLRPPAGRVSGGARVVAPAPARPARDANGAFRGFE